MNINIVAFLLGLFGIPLALLIVAHRFRKRAHRVRNAFLGAFAGHCVAGVFAVTLGMIPPEAWTPDETGRGFIGLWALLVFPVVGAASAYMMKHRFAFGAIVGIGGVAMFSLPQLPSQQAGASLVGVIGNWSAVDDGGPALKTDGSAWSGATSREQLTTAMKPFFTAVGDSLVANGTAPGAFPLAVWSGTPNFTNGTIRVQFKMIAGKDDQNAGIVFGLQPNGEYHYIRYNTKDGDVAAWRFANGDRVRIVHGTATKPLPLNTWHELVVRVQGAKVIGTVNGSITMEHTLDKPVTGRVGVWTKRDAVTLFRNYRVEPQASPR
jgi:hypothetical protein